MATKRPGRHTPQSFNDQQAISALSAWLAKTQRAMPDLKANDKWPNIDGYIEVTDENGFQIGTLKTQVKKLSEKNARKKQHTFKDEKFLSYCRESTDWIPILFIGVDLGKQKAFWLHVDHYFLEKTERGKTITFPEENIIAESETGFIEDWKNLIYLYNSRAEEFEKYKKAFSMVADVITPALGRTDERFIAIHQFLDTLNYNLDHGFTVVKRILYPRTWKLGFAYHKYEDSELIHTLYPIAENRNDVQIKEVDAELFNKLRKEGLGFRAHHRHNPIMQQPEKYAHEITKSETFRILEERLLNHGCSNFLAREYVFAFIDRFYVQMGVENKDVYTVAEIANGFYTYMPHWIQESYNILRSKNRNNLEDRMQSSQFRGFDPEIIDEASMDERNKIQQKVEKKIREEYPPPSLPMSNKNLPLGIVAELLNFLQQTVSEVQRPYKPKSFHEAKNDVTHIANFFSKQDTEYNLKTFFENLQDVYDKFVKSNFPMLQNELSLFMNADLMAVTWSITDHHSAKQSGSVCETYYLKTKKGRKTRKEVLILTNSEREHIRDEALKTNITLRDKEYTITSREVFALDFIYKDTPMFNYIYNKIQGRFKQYFDSF